MTRSRRRIDLDPETPIREIINLLAQTEDTIEFQIGGQRFVIERRDDVGAVEPDPAANDSSPNATVRLLAAAGGWKGLIDGEALKRYIYEGRELDAEIERKRPPRTF